MNIKQLYFHTDVYIDDKTRKNIIYITVFFFSFQDEKLIFCSDKD